MNLKNVIDGLNSIAMEQPEINQYIKSGNIYDLNKDGNAVFSVFCCTNSTHRYDIESSRMDYSMVIYYVDRLQSNGDNKIEIQSTGIQTLNNILRTFSKRNDVEVSNISYEVFTESFKQLCAGCYCTVTISVYDAGCTEIFD